MIGTVILSPSAAAMRELLHFPTRRAQELVDITDAVTGVARRSGISDGLVHVYAQGATAAVMIQENWDESVQEDVIDFLAQQIPRGVWKHDAQDGNGDAHLKAGLVGPSETIPLIDGQLGLSRWQNIFFCEFDGPRRQRSVVVTVLADR
ncbi:MAG: secondary thiamine-phosphate synthase enzyme YjbQ [Synechococcaceae cyanobacterium]